MGNYFVLSSNWDVLGVLNLLPTIVIESQGQRSTMNVTGYNTGLPGQDPARRTRFRRCG